MPTSGGSEDSLEFGALAYRPAAEIGIFVLCSILGVWLFSVSLASTIGQSWAPSVSGRSAGAVPEHLVPGSLTYLVAAAPTNTTVPALFSVKVTSTPRGTPLTTPQEVTGMVYDRSGNGLEGASVHVWTGTWEAFDSSKGGSFKFVLTPGQFQIQLANLPSEIGRFSVDPKTQIQIEFRETAAGSPTTTSSPRPPTATSTARATATPTPTVATATPTYTPTPDFTPLPDLGTPIAVDLAGGSRAARTPTPATAGSLFDLPFSVDFSIDALRRPALWGVVVGLVGSFALVVVMIVRK